MAVSATGPFLITLSVTYLLPVVSASVASRAFASSALSLLAQQQLAYPVLHLLHSSDRGSSAPPAVAALDDHCGDVRDLVRAAGIHDW